MTIFDYRIFDENIFDTDIDQITHDGDDIPFWRLKKKGNTETATIFEQRKTLREQINAAWENHFPSQPTIPLILQQKIEDTVLAEVIEQKIINAIEYRQSTQLQINRYLDEEFKKMLLQDEEDAIVSLIVH